MGPTIHCVRHAQGFHNLNVANHNMHDPLLTTLGEDQCRELQKAFPYHSAIDLVVASPIKRTLYTALLGFDNDLQSKDLKIIGLPELQETSDLPCDTGSSPEEIAKEFEGKPVDLTLVKPGWNSKTGKWAASAPAIRARAKEARLWLSQRPEKAIVVVTHGGFLHYFTEDWTDSNRFAGTGWANTEFRSYTFSSSEPSEAHLIETLESKRRREPKALDRNETEQLKRTVNREAVEKAQKEASKAEKIQAKWRRRRRDSLGATWT